MKKCTHKDCDKEIVARDLCKKHWQHFSRYGEPRRASNETNEIIIDGDTAKIILYTIHLAPFSSVLIDAEDVPKIKDKRFYISHGYAKISQARPTVYLHQIISPCEYPLVCDHINRNKLDCRKENLRCVTRRENNLNK